MIELGQRARDVVTGFEGQVIARAEYLYAAPQVLVAATSLQAAADSRWLDEGRVEPLPGRGRPPGFRAEAPDAR